MEISDCEICAALPDFAAADLRGGRGLPGAAPRPVNAPPTPEGFWDTVNDYVVTKSSLLCGRLYTYNYHYEFSVGYVGESVWLERLAEPGRTDSRPSLTELVSHPSFA